MKYSEYRISRDLAWQILIQEEVTELPIRVTAICESMGIMVHSFHPERNTGSDGFSSVIDGHPHIFVSDACNIGRQRFTAAHELGHILLGHVGKYKLVNREPSMGDNPIEQEANVFASRLLAPACVLWALDCRTPEQIAALCNISLQAATFRADRMGLLYDRGMFLTSALERRVYEQFHDFITKMKEH